MLPPGRSIKTEPDSQNPIKDTNVRYYTGMASFPRATQRSQMIQMVEPDPIAIRQVPGCGLARCYGKWHRTHQIYNTGNKGGKDQPARVSRVKGYGEVYRSAVIHYIDHDV